MQAPASMSARTFLRLRWPASRNAPAVRNQRPAKGPMARDACSYPRAEFSGGVHSNVNMRRHVILSVLLPESACASPCLGEDLALSSSQEAKKGKPACKTLHPVV